jgi:hypothetical protein
MLLPSLGLVYHEVMLSLARCCWAPSYQRDISSIATQVTIEQPSKA